MKAKSQQHRFRAFDHNLCVKACFLLGQDSKFYIKIVIATGSSLWLEILPKTALKNKLTTYALTHFKGLWHFVQNTPLLEKWANKFLINNAIYKVPTRPLPYSMMTLEPTIPGTDIAKKTDTYTSWDSFVRSHLHRPTPPP